ncbi:hypothetical protein [Streptomyces murinus]|uniref:hypothetical protein n=1 Tax=Streptomyces murinus TaxID=33900 RepID=UPI0018F4539A|nr:hypothetical protein [Streptomyces murinus]
MFRETITHSHGTSEGTASESHALLLMRRAARRGYGIEATREGGAVITWTRRQLGTGALVHRSIRLHPEMPVGKLTDAVVRDLRAIDDARSAEYVMNDHGRRIIRVGLGEISAMATAAIRARRLVTDQGGRVRLTLTARLGLLAHAHRTVTTEPQGWARPADIGRASVTAGLNRPGRRAGMIRSSASTATCSCGQLHAFGGNRDEARRLAHLHLQDVAAAFVTGLPTAFTDAVTA